MTYISRTEPQNLHGLHTPLKHDAFGNKMSNPIHKGDLYQHFNDTQIDFLFGRCPNLRYEEDETRAALMALDMYDLTLTIKAILKDCKYKLVLAHEPSIPYKQPTISPALPILAAAVYMISAM